MKAAFKTSNGQILKSEEVIQEIKNYMNADPKREYKIFIGTDSEELGNNRADFVTAIVVHRVGNGGRYFWHRSEFDKLHTIRDRIWQEVLTSLDIAKDFISFAKDFNLPEHKFEIHVDVSENGKTGSMIQGLVGIIRANDFEARIKPNSFAASTVADRHNHNYRNLVTK
ncbi:TPA: hypothetical protein DGT35_02205 [Patescibacteria group bacterium]|nr:hypothetical protein [Patescibacteria group bacterium]|tara:strand:+ start:637 stop:1143 length:507 start_codon:yes stop_codon:yes gene_type:complete